jgi:hypothetical protein
MLVSVMDSEKAVEALLTNHIFMDQFSNLKVLNSEMKKKLFYSAKLHMFH